MRDAWRLAKPYWLSDDKWWAWCLSFAVIMLNVGLVYINVLLNYWNNDLFNALQNFDEHAFFALIAKFALLALSYIFVGVHQTYLKQMLHLRWRLWMTRQYLSDWLNGKAYYRLQLEGNQTDNPDQRIADDIDRFTDTTLGLGLGLLSSMMTLFSFLGILWSLSGNMVWFALLYSIAGTWITIKLGRPLVSLNFLQQRYEADFRFSLVRLRENTEGVALYSGEAHEAGLFQRRFNQVVDNFRSIMNRTKLMNWWTYSYDQMVVVFPFLVATPLFFSKKIQLGGLMQTVSAFGHVQNAFSFVVATYTTIAAWQSVVQRLVGFEQRVCTQEINSIQINREGDGVDVKNLNLNLPEGRVLYQNMQFHVDKGERVLITGSTGRGKSTLLRAMAGIWPYGSGEIRLGVGSVMFLPQKPYLPLGTLREAFNYPSNSDVDLEEVMTKVGLEKLMTHLDESDNWALKLSLGEQQRLSFARVLLTKPDMIFLDEATSALDEPSEAYFYGMFSWNPTIVSVGHRATLAAFHGRVSRL